MKAVHSLKNKDHQGQIQTAFLSPPERRGVSSHMIGKPSKPLVTDSTDAAAEPDAARIYLRPIGGVVLSKAGFYQPMYKDLAEVLDLIKIRYEGINGKILDYIRTFESSTFEESEWVPASYVGFEVQEYLAFEKGEEDRTLLFRVQPVLLSHRNRIEVKIHREDRALGQLIAHYLGICARMNNARFILQD
ncbi:MAG: hypothetical protein JRF56_04485 [Deltaproteobacteria bacterium]|jgi:hypothetical protein|nr:hypothetical protein [Deltaproteobacteria bacterium]